MVHALHPLDDNSEHLAYSDQSDVVLPAVRILTGVAWMHMDALDLVALAVVFEPKSSGHNSLRTEYLR